jgi:hypothetical protein
MKNMIIRSAFLPAYKAGHPADLPVKSVDEWVNLTSIQAKDQKSAPHSFSGKT